MIGTSHELLLYMSYDSDIVSVLKLTPSRLRLLRHKLSQHKVSEEYIISALVRMGCRCIRPRVVLPCIVQDKNGRRYDEYTFVKMFFSREIADRYQVDYEKTMRVAESHNSINRPLFKHILKSRRAWIVLDNMVLDSVWSFEPIELNYTKERVTQVRNMLATSVPFSDNPRDILTYRRNHPVTWTPDGASSHQQTAT